MGKSRRYEATPGGLRTIAALSVLRDKVLKPLLAGITANERDPQPTTVAPIDIRLEAVRSEMALLLAELKFAA